MSMKMLTNMADNDNDNDNEIFFIAKRYTVHHQHIDKGNNTYHMCEKYKPGKGGLKPWLMICNIIWENATLKLFCKFGPLKWNPCWLIMLNELIWY